MSTATRPPAPVQHRGQGWIGDHAERLALVPAWAWHVLIALVALVVRVVRLGVPGTLVFDETYYVKQAWSMTRSGVELRVDSSLDDSANAMFASGTPGVFTGSGDLVVHPPLGKWLIAAGESAFGVEHPYSWRIATAIAGALTVFVLARLVATVLGAWWGALAGALLAFETTSFAVSRTGILDSFLALFATSALLFVVLDRRWSAAALSRWSRGHGPGLYGPVLTHPWLWAAGASLGAMSATKWSGAYLLAALGVYVVGADALARRRAGVVRWHVGALPGAGLAFVRLVGTAVVVYVASWAGWFASSLGYDRYWADSNPAQGPARLVPPALRSLWHYHTEIYDLSAHLSTPHPYATHPAGWLLQDRPTLFYFETRSPGTSGCAGPSDCYAGITSLGTVPLWWLGVLAILACVSMLVAGRARTGCTGLLAGIVVVGIAGEYLPWFTLGNRTIYSFYTAAFAPVVVLAAVTVLASLADRGGRRESAARHAGVVLLALTLSWFVWFYPVLAAVPVSPDAWQARMGLWKRWS